MIRATASLAPISSFTGKARHMEKDFGYIGGDRGPHPVYHPLIGGSDQIGRPIAYTQV